MQQIQKLWKNIKENWLLILIAGVVILIVIQVMYRVITPEPEALLDTDPIPGASLNPTQSIRLLLSYSPKNNECQVNLDTPFQEQSTVEIENDVITLSPKIGWLPGKVITVDLQCPSFSQQVSFQVQTIDELPESERMKYQTNLDFEFAATTKKYLEDKPYLDAFPIERDQYRLLFLRSQNKVLVSTELTLSPEQKEAIRSSERQQLDTIGVPSEISIVFTDELNSATINTTQP